MAKNTQIEMSEEDKQILRLLRQKHSYTGHRNNFSVGTIDDVIEYRNNLAAQFKKLKEQ